MEIFQQGETYALLCAMTWASAVIFFRKSGEQISPLPLNLFKNSVSLILFLPTLGLLGIAFFPQGRSATDWWILLASGALGIGVADTFFFAALNRLGASRVAIVDCLYSPFVVICAYFYLGEPVGLSLLLAVALMIGAILLGTWAPAAAAKTRHELRQIITGVVYGALAMLLMAWGIVLAKPVLNHSNPWWSTTVRLCGGVALLGLQGLFRSYRQEIVRCYRPGPLWRIMLPATLLGTYLAMLFWITGMTYTHTTIASVLTQTSTIFVLILAAIFLKEPLTHRKIIAILLGTAGAILVTFG